MKNLNKLLPFGIALEILVLIFAYLESQGDWTLFFQACARLSGRVSLLYFAFILVYTAQNPSVKKGSEVLRVKSVLTGDFAILHLIHGVFLAIAVYLSGFELVPFRVAGGALAYALIVAAPLVISRHWVSEKTLRKVQPIYIIYVWLIFFMTYLSRVRLQTPTATGSMPAYYVLIAITTGLILYFLFANLKRKPA
jgi:hypothetical protein